MLCIASVALGGGLAGCMQPLLEGDQEQDGGNSSEEAADSATGDDDGNTLATDEDAETDGDEDAETGGDDDTDDGPDELELSEAWERSGFSHVYVSDGQFVARDSPNVYLVSRDGEVLWSTESSDPDRYTIWPMEGDGLARTDEFVFINYTSFTSEPGDYDGRVYAYDADDGSEQWRHDTGLDRLGALVATEDAVYYGGETFEGDEAILRSLDIDSQEIQWERSISDQWPRGLIHYDSTLYSSQDSLYAIDPATGDVVDEYDDVSSSFFRVDETLYFDQHQSVVAFNLEREAVELEVDLERNVRSTITVEDGVAYGGDRAGYIFGYDLDDETELWTYRLDGSIAGSPRPDGEIVWAFDDTSTIWAFDATDGTPLYRRETDAATDDPMAPFDGRVYFPEPHYTAYDVERP